MACLIISAMLRTVPRSIDGIIGGIIVAWWTAIGPALWAEAPVEPTQSATQHEGVAVSTDLDIPQLIRDVTIHRDAYGVPHVFGKHDESVIFGYGYAQAEDFFWQIEDVYILALGRYSEVHGPKGLNSDLLNRAFEIVPRSQRDFAALDKTTQRLYAAFVGGINYYLSAHPEVRPRLIRQFEPWHVLAYYRHLTMEMTFRFTGLSSNYLPRRNPHIWTAVGSNGWAISGKRTKSGNAMLLANPHMPWFGFAQLMESHLRSEGGQHDKPWNFIGAGFYGCPMPALGHNDRLGWTLVTNEPDIADLWLIRFTNPDNPLAYEYDGGWRNADTWQETILVRKPKGTETRKFQLRKTHLGPIVAEQDDQTMLAARISGLFETIPMRQSLQMVKSNNLAEFRNALALMQILYMNVLYADCDGNVQFVYTGRVPRRNPKFDWSKPVEGNDPATDWLGIHSLDEMPQVVNPPSGFVQNCNSSPLITTDGDNPRLEDYPAYMIGDADQHKRRALRSLELLRGMNGVSFEQWQRSAFDTEVYWARQELPRYAQEFQALEQSNPQLTTRVRPYLDHLLAWDARISADSTAATLCQAWYEQLYGRGYPGETMLDRYANQPEKQLEALAQAAERLQTMHGTWQIAYGQLYRIQRRTRVADLIDARFDDKSSSLPSLGGHGPMGVLFTQYSTPSLNIPWLISQRRRYGIVGTSYMATYEFAPEGVRGASLVPFGTSGDPNSLHFFDQAPLLSEQKLKPELFSEQQVLEGAVRSYHPGDP